MVKEDVILIYVIVFVKISEGSVDIKDMIWMVGYFEVDIWSFGRILRKVGVR